jgi:cell pole-organizing protein PopZ
MLQPMLAQWIDAHLPAMVERLVQKEIERMSDEKR